MHNAHFAHEAFIKKKKKKKKKERYSGLSNRPGGDQIGAKIPDWMSNNLAGRENKMTGTTLFFYLTLASSHDDRCEVCI